MPAALFCLLLLAPVEPGRNLLVNPGFESDTGWTSLSAAPLTLDAAEHHGGQRSLRLANADVAETCGARQVITLNPPVQRRLRVVGWAKAQQARVEQDFSVYLDVHYADGTPLWGQQAVFRPGTHGWEQAELEFAPAKPVASIEVFILFRKAAGTAWVDDVTVEVAPLEFRRISVQPGLYGGHSLSVCGTPSRPGRWAARLLDGETELAAAAGERGPARLEWLGGDQAPSRAELRLWVSDPASGESHTTRLPVELPAAGPRRDCLCWTADSMTRLLPDALPPAVPAPVSLELAGNEAGSYQLALRCPPGPGLRQVRVLPQALRGPGGASLPAAAFEWQQVGYVWLEQLFRHPAYPEATPGWWPDPLLPVTQFNVEPGFSQAVWVTLHVPAGTPAGVYQGQVLVYAAGREALAVPLTVTVDGFDLPVRGHLKTAFALMDGFLEQLYGRPLDPAMRRRYGDFVLAHRLNPDDISRTEPPAVADLQAWAARGLNAFNVMNMVAPRGAATWVCYSEKEVYTPAFQQQLVQRMDPAMAAVRAAGLTDRAYVYTFDERGEDFFPIITDYFGLVHRRWPGVATLTTAKVPLDPDRLTALHVDWACPVTPAYDRAAADRCRAGGHQVWSYVCLGPRYPYANWLADDPLAEARVFWWQAFDQRLDGVLYWGLNIWSRPHNDQPLDPAAGPTYPWSITTGGEYDWLHGDGELLYAGKEGPIGSLRLANLRDGLQDYEVLWRYRQAHGAVATDALLARVTTGWTQFTRDPSVVRAVRHALAQ